MSITMGQLASRFTMAASKVNPVTDQQLRTIAQLGIGYVKEEIQGMHAVDTGTMLNSTQSERAGNTYLIGPTVGYAPYVALGTSRMPARPFHIAAAHRLRRDVKDFLKAGDLGL
jgi:phage gpG-like protein